MPIVGLFGFGVPMMLVLRCRDEYSGDLTIALLRRSLWLKFVSGTID